MPRIFRVNDIIRLLAVLGLLIVMGCSDGENLINLPTNPVTRTFSNIEASLTYNPLDVQVFVPAEAVGEGESVPLKVQLIPTNLPKLAYAEMIYERVAWLSMENEGDPLIMLQKELVVTFPTGENYKPNVGYSVFYFNQSDGQWVKTGKAATITDDGTHAIFAASDFGTWGIFHAIPLHVEAHASRTTVQAPASISLDAIIEGGSPPYSVIWFYGDDSDPEGGLAVSHWYEAPMKYTATCIVVDGMNREVSDSIDLNLY
jgi:hypothetical protein